MWRNTTYRKLMNTGGTRSELVRPPAVVEADSVLLAGRVRPVYLPLRNGCMVKTPASWWQSGGVKLVTSGADLTSDRV